MHTCTYMSTTVDFCSSENALIAVSFNAHNNPMSEVLHPFYRQENCAPRSDCLRSTAEPVKVHILNLSPGSCQELEKGSPHTPTEGWAGCETSERRNSGEVGGTKVQSLGNTTTFLETGQLAKCPHSERSPNTDWHVRVDRVVP